MRRRRRTYLAAVLLALWTTSACQEQVSLNVETGGSGRSAGASASVGSSGSGSLDEPCGAPACVATPCESVKVTPDIPGPSGQLQGPVVVDDYAYWSVSLSEGSGGPDSWNVFRVSVCGGAPEVVASGASSIRDMVAYKHSLLFSEAGVPPDPDFNYFGAIWRIDNGGPPEVLFDGLPLPTGIAADTSGVCWLSNSRWLSYGPWEGTTVKVALEDQDIWIGIVVDGNSIYYGAAGGVRVFSKGASAVTKFATFSRSGALAMDKDAIYAVDLEESQYTSRILRLPKDGAGEVELVHAELAPHITLDEAWVYYHDYKNIWRVAKMGGAPEKVAPMGGVSALGSDAFAVYWYDHGLYRMKKPE